MSDSARPTTFDRILASIVAVAACASLGLVLSSPRVAFATEEGGPAAQAQAASDGLGGQGSGGTESDGVADASGAACENVAALGEGSGAGGAAIGASSNTPGDGASGTSGVARDDDATSAMADDGAGLAPGSAGVTSVDGATTSETANNESGTANGNGSRGPQDVEAPASNATTTEVPAGTCYVEQIGDVVVHNNTNTGNAIQLALNAALAKAASAGYGGKSVTIVVRDGTYEGNIIISPTYTVTENGTTVTKIFAAPEGFVLIIRGANVLNAEGDALAAGGVGANVTANFSISGLATEISGLFFSNGNTIAVSDAASFTLNGTSGNDSVTVTLTDVGTSAINMGAGDDAVAITYV